MCKEPNSSVLAVADVGSKAVDGIAPEDNLFGSPMTAHSCDGSLEFVGSVKRDSGIVEQRKSHIVASSVQQTEDLVGTGTLSTDCCPVGQGQLADMNAHHSSGTDSQAARLPCDPY